MIEMCAYKLNVDNMAEFDAKNNEYLDKILALGKVELRQFPAEVIKELHKVAEKINQEVADSDPDARKLYESYKKFRDGVRKYFNISEVAYSEALRGAKII
jgi:TRAP-type mannitol/chloroaromatic compound transport system substrate-binding protein